jgi:hypothetical protein
MPLLVFAMLGVLLASSPSQPAPSAQSAAVALNARIDAAIARGAPGAKLDLEFATPPGQLPSQYRRWKVKDAAITMTYVVTDSTDAAANLLRVRSQMGPTGSTRVQDVGDEAYALVNQNPDANKRMNFRRGNLVVELGVPEKMFDAVLRELLTELDRTVDGANTR